MNSHNGHLVYIVDDDEAVRDSLTELLDSVGLPSRCYPSASEFIEIFDPGMEGCLVLDIRMPGMSGLDLQQKLIEMGSTLPIIFITGHGDIPMAVDAMKRGAVEFIQKPFRDQQLLDCINLAMENFKEKHSSEMENKQVLARLNTLTPREREILDWIVEGNANKVIALELNISQRTVENHRAQVMKKMGARSAAGLVKMMVEANVER